MAKIKAFSRISVLGKLGTYLRPLSADCAHISVIELDDTAEKEHAVSTDLISSVGE